MANPDNGGLDRPIGDLQPIVDQYAPLGLSRTDVWMLSGLVASEVATPRELRDDVGDFPLRWFGRRTCDGGDMLGGPHRDLCHGTAGTQTVRTFFQNEFNFGDQQIVAIMGAHSVGRMRREDTGNEGTWDKTPTRLDSGYYLEATFVAPDFRLVEVDNSDLGGSIPNTVQWQGIADEGEDTETVITMLNSDLALVMDVNDVGEIDCDFLDDNDNACSRDTPFRPFMEEFAEDTELFLNDFRDVLNLMIDHGHSKDEGCDPEESRICRFV
jgi:cytochrome c peroxidase